MRAFRWFMLSVALLLATACASGGGAAKGSALEKAQYAWSAAIRWGDLEGAWVQLDPAWRHANPLGEIERGRWKQVQITGYRVLDSEAVGPGESLRRVEIGVVNRHTMTERQAHYVERWRWDEARKTWHLTSGLPDLWAGQ